MNNNISIILEKFHNNELSFNETCDKLYNILLEKINEEIYKEIIDDN